MVSRISQAIALGCALWCAGGCESGTADPVIAGVQVTPSAGEVIAGTSRQFSAALTDDQGRTVQGRDLGWVSLARSIATVSATGMVTGVSPGVATIVAITGWSTASVLVTVRPSVAAVTVNESSARIEPGSTLQFTAKLTDADGNTLTGRTVTWSSSNPSAASMTASGLATGVAEGTTTIRATADGTTGSVAMIVSVEPSDMTIITERPFNCSPSATCESDWSSGPGGFSIAQDATAPKSPSNVGQVVYPIGLTGGNGAGRAQFEHPEKFRNYRTVYISAWIKFSPNWVGNPTGNNKMIYVWMDANLALVTEAGGVGSGPLQHLVIPLGLAQNYPKYPGGTPDQSPDLFGNLGGSLLARGTWHRFEYVIFAGTPGVADGWFDGWVDGVKTHHFSGLMWRAAGQGGHFYEVEWNPIWGGGAGTILEQQYQLIDHIYISGK